MSIICSNCEKSFVSPRQYNCHQYFHRNLRNARFVCQYEQCKMQFAKYKNFKMHVYRSHVIYVKDSIHIFKCNFEKCDFVTGLKFSLSSHMYDHIRTGKVIKCPYSECSKSVHLFKTVVALKSHFYRLHYADKKQPNSSENISSRAANKPESEVSFQTFSFDPLFTHCSDW